MDTDIDRLDVLKRASENAERILGACTGPEAQSVPIVVRETWLTASVIHCDLTRLVIALEQCPVEGIARLLWYGDIASCLIEARDWFLRKGNKSLLDILAAKGQDSREVRAELRRLADESPLHEMDQYAGYRNKVGHHYDNGLLDHLHEFSRVNAETFYGHLTNYAIYSTGWVQLCKKVIQLPDSGPMPSARPG